MAIVGGGLAGCFTAFAFAAAGIKVALLEAERLGFAGGARGNGVLQPDAAPSYRDLEARYGRRVARALFEASRRAVLDLAAAARRLGINTAESADALRVLASYGADETSLLKDVAARRDAGLDVVWLKAVAAARDSRVEAARAAVRLRGWATADPYELLTGFIQAAAKRGAAVFERSAVKKIKVRRQNIEIQTQGGTLTAETIIIATGEATDLYRSLKRHVRADERYLVLTDRLPAAVRRQLQPRLPIITDTDMPPHLIRWTDDGRVLIAGADQPRTSPRVREKVVVQRTGQLMYELSRLYPAISGVMPAYGWEVPVGTTADGMMFAGPHRNYPRHLFAWATRHDPAQAFLASRILLRNYLGQSERDDAYFAFTRG